MIQIDFNPLSLYGPYVPPTFEAMQSSGGSADPEVLENIVQSI